MPGQLTDARITRRRALTLGTVGGLWALLPASRTSARTANAAVRAVSLVLPTDALPSGGRPGVIVRAPARFDLVGLRGADLRGAGAQIRVRALGATWSPWVPLGAGGDHAPDHPRSAPASDPVWTGGADELQLRARRAVRGGRLQLISVPTPDGGAHVRAATAAPRAGGAPEIIPRSAWGADQIPPRADPSYGAVQLAFVHHTVTANAYAPEDSPRIVLAIAKYHRDTNGWNDIGYNFLVDRYGQVFEGRAGGVDQAVVGAQAGGWNRQSTGVATIGDFDKTTFPETGMAVLARLIAWKLSLHGTPTSGTVALVSGGGKENRYPNGQDVILNRVSGHRDGCRTDCPGALLYGQLTDLRSRVARLGPIVTAAPRATLVAAASRVSFGADVILTGRVQHADGSPAPDLGVSIQKRTSTGGWVRVARARTAADGRYESRLTWKREAPLRAQAQLARGPEGRVRSPELSVGLDAVVSLLAPAGSSRIRAGRNVTVRGQVGPSGPVQVTVERQDSRTGRWVAAGTVRATLTKGAFDAAVLLRRPALYRLRAVAGPARSPVRTAPVFVRAVGGAASLTGGAGPP